MRGSPDLQNLVVVCPKIERFIFYFFVFFIIYGIFSKMKKNICQWVEIRKKGTNLQILPGNPCRCLEGDDPCYPDQFEKTCVISKPDVLLQVTNVPSLLPSKHQQYRIFRITKQKQDLQKSNKM